MSERKTLLITGGTGSFGNAVLRRFLSRSDIQIRIFSRDEKKQEELRHLYPGAAITYHIGDIRHYDSVLEAMTGVDLVFHAAALKQVPSCEFYPVEALLTNSLGADNLLRAAIQARVERVIVLSTDKAVYPINAMGLSKAMMERIMVAKSRIGAAYDLVMCGTRYGNVMASRGSVIPLFMEQIRLGKPLSITDPEMTRFMMSLDGALDLVLFAYEHARPGDIFVQKAPAATIDTLVKAVKRLMGVPDHPVRIIGTRHGEKLYETLATRGELVKAEDLGDYYRIPADNRDLNYGLYFTEGVPKTAEIEDYHSHNTRRLDVDELAEMIGKLPEIQEDLKAWRK